MIVKNGVRRLIGIYRATLVSDNHAPKTYICRWLISDVATRRDSFKPNLFPISETIRVIARISS
jgi:hypothetical protein